MDLDEDRVVAVLLQRLGSRQGETEVHVNYDDCRRWNRGVLDALTRAKLLKPSRDADSVICQRCQQRCHRPVQTRKHQDRLEYFVECEEQDDVATVSVVSQRLKRWKTSRRMVAAFVAHEVGARVKHAEYATGRIVFQTRRFGQRRLPLSLIFDAGRVMVRLGKKGERTLEELIVWINGRPSVARDELDLWAETIDQDPVRHQPSDLKRARQKFRRAERDVEWQRHADAIKARRPSLAKKEIARTIFESRRWPGVASPSTIERAIRVS